MVVWDKIPPIGNRVKVYQNTKEILNIIYDVTVISLLKTMGDSDLRETRQIIYHSKGNDESFPKM